MILQRCFAIIIGLMLISTATAQTVRFDTNVGTFDMRLNPMGNENLIGHVENLLAYVESGRYDGMLINRAPDGFVLQMGGFMANTLTLPGSFDDFDEVPEFSSVIVDTDGNGIVDFLEDPVMDTVFDNIRGTVSLALAGGNVNSGNSQFFVNLGDNSGNLDPQGFIPFAEIMNMETIDLILGLQKASLPELGVGSSDIPVLDNNVLVFVERAFVLDSTAAAAAASGGGAAVSSVPEPSALLLAVLACMGFASRLLSRKRPFAA